MKIDIENINTIETKNKVYTKEWRNIYKVIQPEFKKKKTDIFTGDFIKQCKHNANDSQFLPLEVKITESKWRRNKYYMHKWSCYAKRI